VIPEGRGARRARVHWLQHAPFEGLGSIEPWLVEHDARVTVTRLYQDARLPTADGLDWLIVMGGPMSVNDEAIHPWLPAEKRFISEAMSGGVTVLGICLGAQLIASSLGARVYRNSQHEIGWFPVEKTGPTAQGGLSGGPTGTGGPADWLPESCTVFHWHGETFDLPPGARQIARSKACENQAFTLGPRVIGLQFHLEVTPASARAMVEAGRSELVPGPFIHQEGEILADPGRFARANAVMSALLETLPVSRD
jgi:GMP synthase-like glutamine amidotransferase